MGRIKTGSGGGESAAGVRWKFALAAFVLLVGVAADGLTGRAEPASAAEPEHGAVSSTQTDAAPRGDVLEGAFPGFGMSLTLASGEPIVAFADMEANELVAAFCSGIECITSSLASLAPLDPPFGDTNTDIGVIGGSPVVVYNNTANAGGQPPAQGPAELRVVRCLDAGCTTIASNELLDDSGEWTQFSAAFDAAGPLIAVYDADDGALLLLACADPGCTTTNLATVNSAGDVGASPSMVLDPNTGFPVILYRDLTNGRLKLARCGTRTCGTGNLNTVTTVAGLDASEIGSLQLALTSTGIPVFSYRSEDGRHIMLTVCGNAGCTAGNHTTTAGEFEPEEFAGTHDIEIGPGDIPTVAWGYSGDDRQLAVFRCAAASCATGGTLALLPDPELEKASDIALELDTAGIPVIAGWSQRPASVAEFVHHCGDVTCGGSTVPPAPGPFTLSKQSVVAGAGPLQLTVNGSGFINGVTKVSFRGVEVPTQFVSQGQLIATIPGELVEAKVSGYVTVTGSGFTQLLTVQRSSSDVNCDGIGDATDVLAVLQALTGSAAPLCSPDANKTDGTTIADALFIRQEILGLVPPLPSDTP